MTENKKHVRSRDNSGFSFTATVRQLRQRYSGSQALLGLALAACSPAVGSPVAVSVDTPRRQQPRALPAMGVPAPENEVAAVGNPFMGADFYINPDYAASVQSSIDKHPELSRSLEKMKRYPTALWLDRIAAIDEVPGWLEDASEQSAQSGKPVVPVFVIYDLPNRDCAAKASNGELAIDDNGEQRYRMDYIDAIATHFAAYPEQRIVAVVEPDSLPNMISNLGVEKCALSENVYKNSIAYAISKLSMPNVHLYLDAAHAGWLGWESHQQRMARMIKEVLTMAGGTDRIRGLATNVSNYNGLDGDWGKALESSNPSVNEHGFVEMFRQTLAAEGITGMHFLIDTSRNGQSGMRSKWGNWCNIVGAGLGERPRVAPRPGVDAYYWVKPPGESDGIADQAASRFDPNCASADATPGAPEAGQWFDSYFVDLVKNANPPL